MSSSATPELAPAPKPITKLEYFKIFRAYRLAEQTLLNHRLTWNLAVQAFLFAAYGLSLQKLAELQAGENDADIEKAKATVAQINHFADAVPVVGIALSVIILVAVCGAWIVLHELKIQWDHNTTHKVIPAEPNLPDPAGGGSFWARFLGFIPPFLMPIGFLVVWSYILARR